MHAGVHAVIIYSTILIEILQIGMVDFYFMARIFDCGYKLIAVFSVNMDAC